VTKRKEKARRARARSTAGRPRKEGDRYPSGKLKPPLPNQRVIAERRILLGGAGDISKAENPLDLMLARGWITEDEHRAGRAYAFLYVKAGIDLPRLKTADLGEASDRDIEHAPQPGLRLRPEWMDDGDERAMDQLQALWRTLSPLARSEMLDVCCRDSWPQWVIWQAMGKEVPASWDRKRLALLEGLEFVCRAMTPKSDASYQLAAVI